MLRRVTTTVDSLAKIIQTLSSGGMSGHLIARREIDKRVEEGEILFAHGKIVAAKADYEVGIDAVKRMSIWKDCTFSFNPSKESKHTPVVLTPTVVENTANVRPIGERTELRQTPLARIPLGESGKKVETAKLLIVRPEALLLGAVPYRTEADVKALQLLKRADSPRLHRHLFLLVDGHRSVVELIRLMGREKDEIVKALRDLEKLSIIRIPN